jgi:hypothetical protein
VKCVVAQQIRIVAQMQRSSGGLITVFFAPLRKHRSLQAEGFSIQYCRSLVSQTTVCAVLSSANYTKQVQFTGQQ